MEAIHKSETMVITRKRTHNAIKVRMRGAEIESSRSIKNLGLQVDSKLYFKEHASMVAAKVSKTAQNLARIMSNVGALRSAKRRFLASVVMSQMLYGAQVWANTMKLDGRTILAKRQRKVLLRVASAY